jgi:hypothetical protein
VLAHPAPVFLNEVQKTMRTKSSAGLEADETALQRAQAEQFGFRVEVTNESNENPTEHQHIVNLVDSSIPR